MVDNSITAIVGSPDPVRNGATSHSTQFDQPQQGHHGANNDDLKPIAALNPYQPRWSVITRVLDVTIIDLKTSGGSMLTATLVDEAADSIPVVCFGETATIMHGRINPDRIYRISRGEIRSPKKFFGEPTHPYEILFSEHTILEEVRDSAVEQAIPFETSCKFTSISAIVSLGKDEYVNIVAVVGEVSAPVSITTKNGGILAKREVQLIDQSDHSIALVLWGTEAEVFHPPRVPVPCCVTARGVRVGEFMGGRTLVATSKSTVEMNPQIPEADQLRSWFLKGQGGSVHTDLSAVSRTEKQPSEKVTLKKLAQRGHSLALGERMVVDVVCSVKQFASRDPFYAACPLQVDGRSCNKKVIEQDNGSWFCHRCEQGMPQPKLRYILSFQVIDSTGTAWLTAFDEAGNSLLKTSADEYAALLERGNNDGLDALRRRAEHRPLTIRCLVRNERDLKGELRLQTVVSHLTRLNFAAEAAGLAEAIRSLECPPPPMSRR